jgi:hypothetical protein
MQFRGMPVIQAAAILVVVSDGALPTSAGAQSITTEGFRAIDAPTLMQPGGQPQRVMPATEATFHQAVRVPRMQRQRQSSTHNLAPRLTVAVLMGIAGAWVGGQLGATLESDCRCDDPGAKGTMIGFPIGAAAGVTLGLVPTR